MHKQQFKKLIGHLISTNSVDRERQTVNCDLSVQSQVPDDNRSDWCHLGTKRYCHGTDVIAHVLIASNQNNSFRDYHVTELANEKVTFDVEDHVISNLKNQN
jgi:hypothetical protein